MLSQKSLWTVVKEKITMAEILRAAEGLDELMYLPLNILGGISIKPGEKNRSNIDCLFFTSGNLIYTEVT
jgi:hypothetical protein